MNKSAVMAYYTDMFKAAGNLKISTRSISGTKDFTTWEWNLTFYFNALLEEAATDKDLTADMADGREVKMVGVSVAWWNEEGKIVKNNDYAKVVEKFD